MAADNKLLGQFDLVGIPPAPRGVPQIEVSFDIDANGIVNVGASDKSTGKKQSIQIQTSGGLTDSDIERMVKEAEDMREADQAKRDGVQAKNDAENLCYSVEKQLSELKDKMSTEEADDLKSKMATVREAMTTDDNENIAKVTKELQEASWEITRKAYANSSSEEQSGDGGEEKKESKFEEEKKEDEKKEEKKA